MFHIVFCWQLNTLAVFQFLVHRVADTCIYLKTKHPQQFLTLKYLATLMFALNQLQYKRFLRTYHNNASKWFQVPQKVKQCSSHQ